jgi:hypothetical protein
MQQLLSFCFCENLGAGDHFKKEVLQWKKSLVLCSFILIKDLMAVPAGRFKTIDTPLLSFIPWDGVARAGSGCTHTQFHRRITGAPWRT